MSDKIDLSNEFDRQGEPFDEDDFDDGSCYLCGGSRFIVTCCDDLCHGQGWCMHGDGNDDCPNCNKDGEREWIE